MSTTATKEFAAREYGGRDVVWTAREYGGRDAVCAEERGDEGAHAPQGQSASQATAARTRQMS